MGRKDRLLKVTGMSCSGCETRIESALGKLEGIERVKANASDGGVQVCFNEEIISLSKIINAIEGLDYRVVRDFSPDKKSLKTTLTQLTGIGIIITAVYLVVQKTVGFNYIPAVDQSMGYGLLFVVGLLTSLHCVAMCGGINLSQCISRPVENPTQACKPNGEGKRSAVMPSLLYNLGRVASYTLIGGIVGAVGSAVSFSGPAKGVVTIIAGALMVFVGLKILNIIPALNHIRFMPKFFGKKIFQNSSKYGPFAVGLMNGLMPCGPLQAMQLYALGSGSFLTGALSMFFFSTGTVPLLFGIGALSTLFSKKFTQTLFKVSGVLVIILAVIMLGRGFSLAGVSLPVFSAGSIASSGSEIQTVSMEVEPGDFAPITVQKGKPVRWIIRAKPENLNNCNQTIIVPELKIEKKLLPGENIIEFTPSRTGDIAYSCWMGMINSTIHVVDALSNPDPVQTAENTVPQTAAGGCCGLGASAAKFSGGRIPMDKIAVGDIKDGLQTVRVRVNDAGFEPAVLVLQKNVRTKLIFVGEKLNNCNFRLMFPSYRAKMELRLGENPVELMPEQTFTFNCWMGMLNGYVKVVDSLRSFDYEGLKQELLAYKPARAGCCQ